jgi:hypothetical protein
MDYQGRSEQFLWYGPNSKMAPLKFLFELWGRNCAPHIFFRTLEQKWRPRPLICALFQGGGCKRWYFCQICAPETTPLRAVAPQAPPLATALVSFTEGNIESYLPIANCVYNVNF